MRRSLALALPVLAAVLLPALPSSAQALTPAPSVNVVAEAPDFATDAFADPWDFSNAADAHTWQPAVQGGTASLADGRLRYSAPGPGGGHVHLVFPSFDDTAYGQRDGDRVQLDASHYRTAVLRVRASSPVTAAVVSHPCEGVTQPCNDVYSNVQLAAGWGTYRVPLDANAPLHGLRVAVGGGPVDLEFDWVRVVAGSIDPVLVNVVGVAFWDADDDLGNNTTDSPSWGVVPFGGFPAAAYPPGAYRFYSAAGDGSVDDASRSELSAPLHVLARPRLEILDPDASGGEDYITALTGDPWDFSQASDGEVVNARDLVIDGGVLSGTNTDNDPYINLRLASVPLDPRRYHRLTATFSLDGPFDLSWDPGGGSHGRLIWAASPYQWINGNDLVAYPNEPTQVVDLAGPSALEDTAQAPWVTAPVVQLRFDPNEDPGARRWHVDEVRIAADDETSSGGFDVTFADRAFDTASPQGTNASYEVFADTDRSGFDGVRVATGSLESGELVARWDTCDVAPGTYQIHVRANRSAHGVTASNDRYATGPLVVRPQDTGCHGATPDPVPTTDGDRSDLRLAGASRFDTAAAVARDAFPHGAHDAVLVTSDAFADALAAAPLAATLQGPVLLSQRDVLPDATATALADLGVRRVRLLGGTAALSDTIVATLEAQGIAVERLSGPDRFATAAAVAYELVELTGRSDEVVLAAGNTFPDALAGGWRAATMGVPLLLTSSDGVPAATAAVLEALDVERVVAIGGLSVIGTEVLSALEFSHMATSRLAGADRFATAAAVVEATLGEMDEISGVLVASGEAFPDALAAGPAAAATGRLLLLTGRDAVPGPTADLLARIAPTSLRVAGGPAAVAPATVTTLASLAGV